MSQAEKPGDRATDAGEGEPVLRAKYLDYCSARVAEVLLGLTADEIYLLAQEVARESRTGGVPGGSYERSVRLATDHLLRTLPIPPFETWVVAYREDPERFDQEMLGLWRSGVSTPDAPEPDERRSGPSASDEGSDPDQLS